MLLRFRRPEAVELAQEGCREHGTFVMSTGRVEPTMTLGYSNILGRKASLAAQRFIFPGLVWNQERYGNVLREHLHPAGKLRWLEAGCGHRVLPNGLESLEKSAVKDAGFVVGMDMDRSSLRNHRSIDRRVMGSIRDLPFADGSFDLVGCNMVVEHLADPGQCLAELTRVLAPNGVLLVHTPNIKNYMVFLKHAATRLLPTKLTAWIVHSAEQRSEDDIFPTLYRMNSSGRLQKAARDLGLQVESEEFLNGPRPFFSFFLPLAVVQLIIMRLLTLPGLHKFQTTILAVMRKPAHPAAVSARVVAEAADRRIGV
ncbi:MAG TPA: methyltransferase domain-containing protein [Candidatus Sulfotelmatobacter sp.]